MVIEPLNRRHWLLTLGLIGLHGASGQTMPPPNVRQLLAAWQDGPDQTIGLWTVDADGLHPGPALGVPTRAHGLWIEPGGTVLAVARRPGDWLLRWHPATGQTQWCWSNGDWRFNGHVAVSADGQRLWTTETDQGSGQGQISLRDPGSLEIVRTWPSHGQDPHQILVLPTPCGGLPAGTLMVANGGIPTHAETGRLKQPSQRMDPSLVALDPASGQQLGQWQLDDPTLSIRHLAWQPQSRTLGIALQSEHPQPTRQAAAPVLAVWDGTQLQIGTGQPPMRGYGGDICPGPDGGFIVSCPRADALACFDAQGRWRQTLRLEQVCALAGGGAAPWWASGRTALLCSETPDAPRPYPRPTAFDNHWLLRPGA